MMTVLMLMACVLFVGAMLHLQHETFAERATRRPALSAASASSERAAARPRHDRAAAASRAAITPAT